MSEATVESGAICEALRAFAEGALGLATALEGAQLRALEEATFYITRQEGEPEAQYLDDGRYCSYGNGRPLSARAVDRRMKAGQRAKGRGYDYEHWSRRVRELRVSVMGTNVPLFASMLQVSPSCVHHWEAGTGFPHQSNLLKLENLGAGVAGWAREHWRTKAGG